MKIPLVTFILEVRRQVAIWHWLLDTRHFANIPVESPGMYCMSRLLVFVCHVCHLRTVCSMWKILSRRLIWLCLSYINSALLLFVPSSINQSILSSIYLLIPMVSPSVDSRTNFLNSTSSDCCPVEFLRWSWQAYLGMDPDNSEPTDDDTDQQNNSITKTTRLVFPHEL